jgi:hypothetical protein
MDCVPGRDNGGGADLSIPHGDGAPEVIEGPSLFGKVGEEGESKAEREVTLDRLVLRLLRNFIDCGERPIPKL